MRFSISGRTESNMSGMSKLADIEAGSRNLSFDTILLDFEGTTWFEANLSAALGAILSRASRNLNEIKFENMPPLVLSILEKNGFMSFHGGVAKRDYNETTIKFQRFGKAEIKSFNDYLLKHLLSMSQLPNMTDNLKKRIRESILEIFNNAATHGNCDFIFCCGQYFPAKERIDFSVVNLGSTVRKNVREFLGDEEMKSAEAIDWATQEGNTTRTGKVPGGIGLSILRQFLKLNGGQVHIYSGDGYWNQNKSGTVSKHNTGSFFRGTMVNLEFNVDDSSTYKLSSE